MKHFLYFTFFILFTFFFGGVSQSYAEAPVINQILPGAGDVEISPGGSFSMDMMRMVIWIGYI